MGENGRVTGPFLLWAWSSTDSYCHVPGYCDMTYPWHLYCVSCIHAYYRREADHQGNHMHLGALHFINSNPNPITA